jgi:hypothetical protein
MRAEPRILRASADAEIGDRRSRAGRGGFERPVSNADFPISGICQRVRETGSRRLACGRFNGAECRRDPRVFAVSLLCQDWRRAGSAEAELLFLFGPGQRKVSCELRDGHVSRRAALRDGLNDAQRQIGDGRQESDMALDQLFVFADRAKVERGVFEDRLDLVPRPRNSGQQ